jgi:hypothetical protein
MNRVDRILWLIQSKGKRERRIEDASQVFGSDYQTPKEFTDGEVGGRWF